MFVRFLPKLMQDSVCLGDVLDGLGVLPVLFWCRCVVATSGSFALRSFRSMNPDSTPQQSFEPLPDRTHGNTAFRMAVTA